METGSLSEAIYAFIGAYAWYLTFALYVVLAVCQSILGGGISTKKRPQAVAASGDAE